jgi:hypothetical protein
LARWVDAIAPGLRDAAIGTAPRARVAAGVAQVTEEPEAELDGISEHSDGAVKARSTTGRA